MRCIRFPFQLDSRTLSKVGFGSMKRNGSFRAGEHANSWGDLIFAVKLLLLWLRVEQCSKLVWRLKLEADLGGRAVTEVEIGRVEREAWATPEALGLSLAEVL
jgi:hypothetical protein